MFLRNGIHFSPTEGGGSGSGAQAASGEGGQASQQAAQQSAAAGAQGDGQAQSAAKTTEQYEREIAELRKEAGKYRTERNGFEADLKKRTDAELTEAQKLQNEQKQATEKLTQAQKDLRQERTERALEKAARKLNIVDEETAVALVGSKVEYDEDGKPTNVDALLTQLVKDKPFLLAQAQTSGGPGNPARGGKLSYEQVKAMSRAELRQHSEADIDAALKQGPSRRG